MENGDSNNAFSVGRYTAVVLLALFFGTLMFVFSSALFEVLQSQVVDQTFAAKASRPVLQEYLWTAGICVCVLVEVSTIRILTERRRPIRPIRKNGEWIFKVRSSELKLLSLTVPIFVLVLFLLLWVQLFRDGVRCASGWGVGIAFMLYSVAVLASDSIWSYQVAIRDSNKTVKVLTRTLGVVSSLEFGKFMAIRVYSDGDGDIPGWAVSRQPASWLVVVTTVGAIPIATSHLAYRPSRAIEMLPTIGDRLDQGIKAGGRIL